MTGTIILVSNRVSFERVPPFALTTIVCRKENIASLVEGMMT